MHVILGFGVIKRLELNEPALELIKGRKSLLFKLPDQKTINKVLKRWVKGAGLDKHITFHCGRHTCATFLSNMDGVSIQTVSKILGHRDLKTTQAYAQVNDAVRKSALASWNALIMNTEKSMKKQLKQSQSNHTAMK